jgi:hypothetical protein
VTAAHSIFDSLTPSDLGLPPKFVSFRLPQRQALGWLTDECEHPVSAASIPTGVGKTSLAVAYARLLGVKAVYLVATKALEAQVLSDFSSMGMVNVHGRANYTCPNYGDCDKGADHKCSLAQTESCPYSRQVNLAADSDLVVTNYAYYLWSKGVRNKAFADVGLLICDECFPCSTLVDGKPIDSIRSGDLVMSCNVERSLFESKKVTAIMRRRPDKLVRLYFSDGRTVICTPNHPFMCKYEGWKPAFDLESERVLRLRYAPSVLPRPDSDGMLCMRDSNRTGELFQEGGVSQTGTRSLFNSVQSQTGASVRTDDQATRSLSGTHVAEQPYEGQYCPRKNEDESSRDGLEAFDTGGQWQRTNGTAVTDGFNLGMGYGIDSERKTSKERLSQSLQTGHREPGTEGWRGSRRDVTQRSYEESAGSPENFLFDFVRVDRVEVLEQTSDGTFGGLCPDGFVYNIEVEDNHNYFADGILVHNCHGLEHQLGSFASVKLYARELSALKCPYRPKTEMSDVIKDEADAWKIWAMAEAAKLASKSDVRDLDDDEQDLLDRLRKVTRMHSNWVWQFDDRGHCSFEPIRVTAYTRGLLSSVPRVLMMSASLSEFALKLLMPSDTYYDYRAWPPVFPQQNSPVYHIPTVKLSWKSTDEDYRQVIEAADGILDARRDRKGIIHTVSYARTKRTLAGSRNKARFFWNDDAGSLGRVLGEFRQSENGILVTPSVEEGFDFAGAESEFQIVLKFPFPNETQRVVKERCTQIPGYRLHHAAQKIVQIRGRAVRSDTDRAELFILDNAVRQLCGPEGRSYCPPGFRIFTVNDVPPAPPKIT